MNLGHRFLTCCSSKHMHSLVACYHSTQCPRENGAKTAHVNLHLQSAVQNVITVQFTGVGSSFLGGHKCARVCI